MNETLKTGTTTVGIVCKDCVILAADKRATAGNLIAMKKTVKVHQIAPRIAVTTAGSVSDIQLLLKLIKAEVKLKDIRSGRDSTVKEVANMMASMVYSNIRQYFPGVTHFLMAGYDSSPKLYDIFPDGSVEQMDEFVASGSGSVFAYGVLETNYKKGISQKEGIELATTAINAALKRDSASGNGMDVFVIKKDEVDHAVSKIIEATL